MSVRLARPGDARAIAVVHVRSWQAAYRNLVPQGYLDDLDPDERSTRWDCILSERAWPRAGVVVVEEAGQVIGFARICPTRDDDLRPAGFGEITSIYLMSDAWGKGFGRELMAGTLAALSEAGYRAAALWVVDGNERARSFYQAGGWYPDGAVKQDEIADFVLNEVRYRHPLP